MPINVLTGLPRNGKTLRMMHLLQQAAKEAKRPLFAGGIDGLKPGLATVLDDPRRWNDRNPDGSYIVPDGSLIFVDEAWKWFGHLHNARAQATPLHVLAMAEHAHRGLDFVFTTQGPGQLYPFLRTLIQEHTHCVRIMGAEACKLYTWPELNEDVKSASMREAAISTFWKYPKSLYESYHSSNVHTVRFKLNPRVAVLAGLIVAICALGYFGVTYFNKRAPGLTPVAKVQAGQGIDSKSAVPSPASLASMPLKVPTREELAEYVEAYAYQHTPRIAGMSWTAPIFDGRPVTVEPRLLCASVGENASGGCRCYTEQFTPVTVDLGVCMANAVDGEPYNPYRVRVDQMGGAQPFASQGTGAPTAIGPSVGQPMPVAGAGSVPRGQMAHYGAMSE